jgi:hypothetical protein
MVNRLGKVQQSIPAPLELFSSSRKRGLTLSMAGPEPSARNRNEPATCIEEVRGAEQKSQLNRSDQVSEQLDNILLRWFPRVFGRNPG